MAHAAIGGGRPYRPCDVCGVVDDHPRHSFGNANPGTQMIVQPSAKVIAKTLETAPKELAEEILADLLDLSTTDRHMDCCREAGCPLPADDPFNCANRTQGVETKRGKALLAHLEANPVEG